MEKGSIRPAEVESLEKGLKTQAELEGMSVSEVQSLIFHPGFTTAEKVTDVSGRGVGMDVCVRMWK